MASVVATRPRKLSQKLSVVEHLFAQRFDSTAGAMTDPLVTNDQLVAAIRHCNKSFGTSLKTNNPANFLKDYLRSDYRNEDWPVAISSQSFTARQKYRKGRVFVFMPYEPGQIASFPDPFVLADDADEQTVEAVSLPSIARELGRKDEAWLIQVCVHQRVIQTHFAVYSVLDAVDLFHLQNSLKATPGIDAVFLMTYRTAGRMGAVEVLDQFGELFVREHRRPHDREQAFRHDV